MEVWPCDPTMLAQTKRSQSLWVTGRFSLQSQALRASLSSTVLRLTAARISEASICSDWQVQPHPVCILCNLMFHNEVSISESTREKKLSGFKLLKRSESAVADYEYVVAHLKEEACKQMCLKRLGQAFICHSNYRKKQIPLKEVLLLKEIKILSSSLSALFKYIFLILVFQQQTVVDDVHACQFSFDFLLVKYWIDEYWMDIQRWFKMVATSQHKAECNCTMFFLYW